MTGHFHPKGRCIHTELRQQLITEYAKKIYGFAYSKTHNPHDAEDLSQDILVQLLDPRIDFAQIENQDAYIYRICCYTWSNYLRKNKPAWDMLGHDALTAVPSSEDVEASCMQEELYARLRQEIMYLSKMRRQITVMYYFEHKSGDEIARTLGIPASTVRWHMRETKHSLKERMNMTTTSEIYQPVRLIVGHDGWVTDYDMHGLRSDLILQNICVLCREKPLTVEELARTLGIAAIYLEDKIDRLLYLDYLKPVGQNRYQTTFYIREPAFVRERTVFTYQQLPALARPLLELAQRLVPLYRRAGVVDGEFSDNFLTYALLTPILTETTFLISARVNAALGLSSVRPKRKDGSEHFVWAAFQEEDDPADTITDPALLDLLQHGDGKGIKTRGNGTFSSLQLDCNEFGGWRDFEGEDLQRLGRVHTLLKNGETPNEYDRSIIADLCEKGYVRVEDGQPVLLVPVIRHGAAHVALMHEIRAKYNEEWLAKAVHLDELVARIVAHTKKLDRHLPAYLDKNERAHILSEACHLDVYAMLYTLHHSGALYSPTKEEQARICTLIFVNEA